MPTALRYSAVLSLLLVVFFCSHASATAPTGGPLVNAFLSESELPLMEGLETAGCTPTPIVYGQTVTANLDSDCTGSPDVFDDLYSFDAEAGDRVAILMTSNLFDASLALTDANGVVLASDVMAARVIRMLAYRRYRGTTRSPRLGPIE